MTSLPRSRVGSTAPVTRAIPRRPATPVRRQATPVPLVRRLLGDVLRRTRLRQGRTLRQISATAMVSLGYLSEVERGQKEASSELLASICAALDVAQSTVLREVADELAIAEGAATTPAPGDVVAAA